MVWGCARPNKYLFRSCPITYLVVANSDLEPPPAIWSSLKHEPQNHIGKNLSGGARGCSRRGSGVEPNFSKRRGQTPSSSAPTYKSYNSKCRQRSAKHSERGPGGNFRWQGKFQCKRIRSHGQGLRDAHDDPGKVWKPLDGVPIARRHAHLVAGLDYKVYAWARR